MRSDSRGRVGRARGGKSGSWCGLVLLLLLVGIPLFLPLILGQAFLHLRRRRRRPSRHRYAYSECSLQKVAGEMETSASGLEGPICIAPDSEGIQCLPDNPLKINSTAWTIISPRTYLQNSQFMHFLPLTRRDHLLQHPKLLIHLRTSPALNQTMSRLPRDLPPRSRLAGSVLFPLATLRASRLRSGYTL